ncbi:hypothetical protein V6N12_069058 [Hibiscus sabdariffa]|uniref:Uncharacterized protein n=1 Tax=Hibiscus sabdariffa TaxID=183260 RepID=A0ABR2FCQ1_9ROSI
MKSDLVRSLQYETNDHTSSLQEGQKDQRHLKENSDSSEMVHHIVTTYQTVIVEVVMYSVVVAFDSVVAVMTLVV